MSPLELGLWSFPVLLALIFLRMPVGLAMLLVGFVGNVLLRGSAQPILSQFKDLTYGTFSSYSFSIIPLFLLMGQFASIGGLSRSLFNAAEAFVGHRRGGVAMAAIGACAGFGAICGSSLATAATMGQVALPELQKRGYSGALSTGVLAAGGTLGILIPPSVILVIFAILTEQNIAKLFIAAMVPGLLAAVGYLIAIAAFMRFSKEQGSTTERLPWSKRLLALVATWPVLALFVLVVGGIYFGWFTPTEAAAVGAVGAGVAALASGKLTVDNMKAALLETASSTAMIFLILLGANVFNAFLALSHVPQEAAEYITQLALNPWAILALILLVYLVFGCIMDSLSMILLTIPIFYPLVSSLDFGVPPAEFGLWFGVLVLVAVEVGLITPPVGMNLFVINRMAPGLSMRDTYIGVMPFVLSDIIRVIILAAFPIISLFLVRALY